MATPSQSKPSPSALSCFKRDKYAAVQDELAVTGKPNSPGDVQRELDARWAALPEDQRSKYKAMAAAQAAKRSAKEQGEADRGAQAAGAAGGEGATPAQRAPEPQAAPQQPQQQQLTQLQVVEELLEKLERAEPGSSHEVHPAVRLKLVTAQAYLKRNEALQQQVESLHRGIAAGGSEPKGGATNLEQAAVALQEMDGNIVEVVRLYDAIAGKEQQEKA